jgi:hypothetical protein
MDELQAFIIHQSNELKQLILNQTTTISALQSRIETLENELNGEEDEVPVARYPGRGTTYGTCPNYTCPTTS